MNGEKFGDFKQNYRGFLLFKAYFCMGYLYYNKYSLGKLISFLVLFWIVFLKLSCRIDEYWMLLGGLLFLLGKFARRGAQFHCL